MLTPFEIYVNYWLTVPGTLKMQRLIDLYEVGREIASQAENVRGHGRSAQELTIAVARKMYVGDPAALRLLELAQARGA